MKTLKFLIPLVLVIVFVQNSSAKQKLGLYMTAQDYLDHKLSYGSDKIALHAVFGGYKVVVTENGKRHVFSKSEIFGYQLNGQDYRYYNNSAFRIIDTQGFFIYGYCRLVPAGKGPKDSESFFFSPAAGDEIKPLTMDNLQVVFAKKTRFLYTIQGFFKADNELISYDANLKEYKLKYLYTQTTNK